MRKIIIVLTAGAVVCAVSAFAGKEGTSGAQFLKVGVGARAAAMGDAYDPVASGPEAMFWNAAGLVSVENQGFTISDNEWIADTRMVGAGYARKFGFGTVGFQANSMMYGNFDETTVEEPNGTGNTFSANDMAVGVSIGRRLTDRFAVGGTVKFLRLAFSGVENVDPAMGVAFDVGTQYNTGFRTLRMSIALQNLGPDLQYGGTYQELQRTRTEFKEEEFSSFSLPVIVRLGVAYDPLEHLTLAVNASHPNDSRERVDVGGEWWAMDMLAIRAGYKVNYYEASYAGGVGLKFGGFKTDFAYTGMGRLENSLKGTVAYDF
jgi:hypothetical protein